MKDENLQDEKVEDLPSLTRYFWWAENPSKVKRAIVALVVLCVVLFLLDFVAHRHAYFSLEAMPGFYAIAGFAAFTTIVLLSKAFRSLIGREEDYYAPRAVDAEDYPEEGLDKQQWRSGDSS